MGRGRDFGVVAVLLLFLLPASSRPAAESLLFGAAWECYGTHWLATVALDAAGCAAVLRNVPSVELVATRTPKRETAAERHAEQKRQTAAERIDRRHGIGVRRPSSRLDRGRQVWSRTSSKPVSGTGPARVVFVRPVL